MIFDCDEVTTLVLEWQRTKERVTMDRILELSMRLIEALVSQYDPTQREDLIHQAVLRVMYASQYYLPNVGNLHNYFTTVIKNACVTYLQKQVREPTIDLELITASVTDKSYTDDDTLQDLMVRNRKRFPSIPACELDDISELIYYHLVDGEGKAKGLVVMLMEQYNLQRPIATCVYHSSLIYLRSRFKTFAMKATDDPDEFSILPDLEEVVGPQAYSNILLMLSGMYIKIP